MNESSDDKLERLTLNPSKPAFGIDLGTTNSVIGYFSNGRVEILVNSTGKRTVPSYVSYSQDPPIVGEHAQRLMKTQHEKVVYDAKRMIGLSFNNSAIQQNKDFWTFNVVEENNRPVYDVGNNRKILPEHVSSEVLRELKKIALERVPLPENEEFQAVITVPDYFSQAQKQGTLDAAKIAGIKVLSLITEPNAAAFAYGYDHNRFDDYNIFVFDIGGGTCDISVLKVRGGNFEVVGRAGDNQLGGRDFDNLLLNYYAKKIKAEQNFDVFDENNLRAKIRLRELCEKVKKEFRLKSEEIIELNNVHKNLADEYISYEVFTRETGDLVTRCGDLCERAIKESGLDISEINEVLLVGGSSRVKSIKTMLHRLFPNQTIKESINPDEAVAYGATIRAAQILDSKNTHKVLYEKLPIGIGVALVEDRYEIILRRNTSIPSETVKKDFTTAFHDQTCMTFEVYEGERLIASKNTLLGSFSINVPPKPVGEVVVPLSMSINENGILTAYAEYKNQKEKLIIDSEKIISGDNIQEMLNALETNRNTDKAEMEAKRARMQLRQNIEFIKDVCEKEKEVNTEHLTQKIKEIDEWLFATKEPLTKEIREKFVEIEDEATKLLAKYHKTIFSFKENREANRKESFDCKFTGSDKIAEDAEKLKEAFLEFIQKRKQPQIVVVVPDVADQNCRKALLTAAESLRENNKEKRVEEILKVLEENKFEPPRTRILNRTNAIAIAYLRKLVEDTKKIPFDRKIPELNLFVYCVDMENFYSAKFETKLGVVRQTKFKNYAADGYNIKTQEIINEKNPSEILAVEIFKGFFSNLSIEEGCKVVFVINEQAFHSEDGTNFSPADWISFDDESPLLRNKVFDHLPKLPSPNYLSLLGADTKSKMLCGEVDYIDYDVPPVALHEAKLTFKNYQVSVVANLEQLPIERTIFESEKNIDFQIEYKPPIDKQSVHNKEKMNKFQAVVSRSGIFVM